MPHLAAVIRLVAYLLVMIGIVFLIISGMTDEGVNDSGFVPGVSAGYVAIAVGGLGLILSKNVRERRHGPAALVIGLMVWLATSTFLFVWLPAGSLREVPMGSILAVAVFFGFFGTILAVIWVLGLAPAILVLAWLVDRVPALRRRHAGDWLRREIPGFSDVDDPQLGDHRAAGRR